MRIYYNDNDASAAAWLRQLIAAGILPPGDVDQRSILDVQPDDLSGYGQCHFFAGIGGWPYALGLAGWPADRPVWTGSCPCQPLSGAGQHKGHEDERHLWPAFFRLIAECRPATVFGEQVAGKDGREWLAAVRADLEGCGYACGAADLPAAGVGSPQRRQRLYWLADAGDPGSQGWLSRRPDPRRQDLDRHDGYRGATGVVADADDGGQLQRRGSGGEGEPRHESRPQSGGCGSAGDLGDAEGGGCGERRDAPRSGRRRHADRAIDPSGVVADAAMQRPQQQPGEGSADLLAQAHDPQERQPEPGRHGAGAGGMADTGGGQLPQPLGRPQGRDGTAATDAERRTGAADGFWRDADWLFCRDGKWRPVEPGTFPLAHGLSARLGRLRGYGNAIVPQAAVEVIAAFLELEEDAA